MGRRFYLLECIYFVYSNILRVGKFCIRLLGNKMTVVLVVGGMVVLESIFGSGICSI